MKVYDFCEPWLDGSVILRNLIDQSLLLCALFWRPWDVPCADIVPTRCTSARPNHKKQNSLQLFEKNRNRATIFAIKCVPTTFFVKLTVQSAYKVPPGEPLGAFKISIRYTDTTRTFLNKKFHFFLRRWKKRHPAGRRIAGAPRKAIWAPKMSNCGKETSDTQKL